VEQTNLYYQKLLYKLSASRSLTDNTFLHKITVFYLFVKMRHVPQNKLKTASLGLNSFKLHFYDNTAT